MSWLLDLLGDAGPLVPPVVASAFAVAVPRLRRYAPALLLLTLALTFWFGRWDGAPKVNVKFDATVLLWGRTLVRRTLGGAAVALLGLVLGAQRGELRRSLLVVGPGLGLFLSGFYLGNTLRQAVWSPTGLSVADLGEAIHRSLFLLAAGVGLAVLGEAGRPSSV